MTSSKTIIKKLLLYLFAILLVSFTISACQNNSMDGNSSNDGNKDIFEQNTNNIKEDNEQNNNANTETETDTDLNNDSEKFTAIDEAKLKELKVNELGEVMVLMYHTIGDKEDEWERTKDNFRNDLKVLYENNYYLVNARDFASGNLNVPLGKTPVVLTFDDGTEGHFRFLEKDNGELIVDPDCAVGIIENFALEHPDFGLAATFYVFYPVPFRQNEHPEWRQLKFEYLTNLGMEIGNHSFGHDFLNKLTDEEVQQTLAKNILSTQKLLPNYSVDTLALPYGIYPKNKEYAVSGKFEQLEYNNKGVFLVGSNPSKSPYSIDFNLAGIPRIRAASVPSDFFNQWVDYYKNNPEKRFVSDGDVNTITVPKDLESLLNVELISDKTIRLY